MNLNDNPLTKARALLLLAAFGSFVFSVALFFTGSKTQGIFVGLWVPSIIALGAFLAPRAQSSGARSATGLHATGRSES